MKQYPHLNAACLEHSRQWSDYLYHCYFQSLPSPLQITVIWDHIQVKRRSCFQPSWAFLGSLNSHTLMDHTAKLSSWSAFLYIYTFVCSEQLLLVDPTWYAADNLKRNMELPFPRSALWTVAFIHLADAKICPLQEWEEYDASSSFDANWAKIFQSRVPDSCLPSLQWPWKQHCWCSVCAVGWMSVRKAQGKRTF